jgi:hypothetical protein
MGVLGQQLQDFQAVDRLAYVGFYCGRGHLSLLPDEDLLSSLVERRAEFAMLGLAVFAEIPQSYPRLAFEYGQFHGLLLFGRVTLGLRAGVLGHAEVDSMRLPRQTGAYGLVAFELTFSDSDARSAGLTLSVLMDPAARFAL